MPASEALLDVDSIKRFRSRYREKFGATATQDPLYQALSEGRRMAGMEHWLPLLEERLDTLFDHLGENDLVIRDAAADQALEQPARGDRRLLPEPRPRDGKRSRAATVRSSPTRSTSPKDEWERFASDRPIHLASPFPEPESDRIIDFGVEPARDFAPERAQQANVYEAVAKHVADLRRKRPQGRARKLHARRPRAPERPARGSWPQGAEARRQLAGSARLQDPAGAARPAARPRLHHARRRRAHRAGHARRPPRPPPQEAQGRRRLPRRAGDALARRPRRPRRSRHRPLRGADADPGQQGRRTTASRSNMRAATSSTSRSRTSSC